MVNDARNQEKRVHWFENYDEILARMKAWTGSGPPPNYLAEAWQRASPSLFLVARTLPEEQCTDLICQAHMTSCTRIIIRIDAFLDWFEERQRTKGLK